MAERHVVTEAESTELAMREALQHGRWADMAALRALFDGIGANVERFVHSRRLLEDMEAQCRAIMELDEDDAFTFHVQKSAVLIPR